MRINYLRNFTNLIKFRHPNLNYANKLIFKLKQSS